jgi:dihydrofolate reductase
MTVVAGAEVSSNLSETLQNRSGGDLWVIGGGEIYYQAMPYLKELYITQVYLTGVVGSAVAPDYEKDFSLTAATPIQVSSTGIEYRFEIWSRNV